MSLPTVHSFYRSNIPPEMVASQAKVFDHLGIPLQQWLDDKSTHCEWINTVMRDEELGEMAVIADIDAFPLSRAGYDRLIAKAETGAIAGLAQVANHKDPTRIYAAPMFTAVKRSVYRQLGSPSMCRTKTADVGQVLTDLAQDAEVPVWLIYPAFAMRPRWPLADYGVYGYGTFYGDHEFFHLFESRHPGMQELFGAVADGVVSGRHDWQRYLEIMDQAAPRAKRKKFLGLF